MQEAMMGLCSGDVVMIGVDLASSKSIALTAMMEMMVVVFVDVGDVGAA
jgi:hypothetical protein